MARKGGKRGRPRKPGPRDEKGRLLPVVDHGTPEAQAKRRALVGDADPALSASAPGILFAAGHLDREQYDVALHYRILRCALYGPPWPAHVIGGDPCEIRSAKLQRKFDAMCAALTDPQKHVVSEVAVFDVLPTWFFAARLKLHTLPEDHRERELLLSGLNALLGRETDRAA